MEAEEKDILGSCQTSPFSKICDGLMSIFLAKMQRLQILITVPWTEDLVHVCGVRLAFPGKLFICLA